MPRISGFEGSLHLGEKAGPIIDTRELEVITLEFQKITVTSVTGGTTATDDWEAVARKPSYSPPFAYFTLHP